MPADLYAGQLWTVFVQALLILVPLIVKGALTNRYN